MEFAPISPRIQALVDKRENANKNGNTPLNVERSILYTDYYKTHEAQYPIMKRAGALEYWCRNCTTPVFDEDILVGHLGPDYRTINYYVEWTVGWLDLNVNDTDERFKKAWQTPGCVWMTDETRRKMQEVVAFWKGRTMESYLAGILPEEVWGLCANGANNYTAPDFYFKLGCKPQGHYIANFDKAVNVGFGAVRREAQAKMDEMCGHTFGNDARKYTFYRAVTMLCDGIEALCNRYADACRKKAEEETGDRRAELMRMADSLNWISKNPARTYWEGLQIMLIYQMILSTDAQQHGESYGRIDKACGHLLERELSDGTITMEQAQEYTDAFLLRSADFLVMDAGATTDSVIKYNESGKSLYANLGQHMTLTSGLNITIGGTNGDGSDASNTMTRMVINTYARLRLPDPTVAIRIHKDTPEDLFELAIESSKQAGGMPQFENDEVIVPGLVSRGMTLEDARNYGIVGCVEPGGNGNDWPACGCDGSTSIWSLLGCVVFAINGGVNPLNGTRGLPCKKLYEYDSFDEFQAEVERQAKWSLDWEVTLCNFFEQYYSEVFPCISASIMTEGCMESGKDVTWGGAKYNSTGITCLGTANVADSLMAIKKLCFDDKTVPLRTMYDALLANWVGYEDLQQTIINDVPHYGNDIDEVDQYAAWGLGLFANYLRTLTGPRGSYCGGTFTMTAHLYFGINAPATPDGRVNSGPLADAISSRQGLDKNGPTAYMRSAAKLPHDNLINGDQLNIRFSPTSVQGEGGTKKLMNLIQTYFDLSGMQVQFNVVSTAQLYKAQDKPEDYKNLVVRIAGFSAYFVELDKNCQDDFITRTEQAL